jgi:RsmE family RNA methyltransferase
LDLTLKKIKQLGYNPVCASELRPDLSLISYLSSNPNVNVCVIVGCEGGFDKSEFDFLYEQNVLQVKLNNNVLKAETAAIAAISQIMGIKCSEF